MMTRNSQRRFTIKLRLMLTMTAIAALTASCAAPNGHRDALVDTMADTLVTVATEDDQRIRFSGKGAGAGIALSSSMGPAGIAIGVAIDEGIAKDIGRALATREFDIAASVKTAFTALPLQFDLVNIRIVRYGFVTQPSDKDLADAVGPQLYLDVVADGQALTIRIPEDPDTANLCTLNLYELAAIRTNGRLAAQSLNEAAQCAATLVRAKH